MPFVEGESLRHRLKREKQLPLDDALRIAREGSRAATRGSHPLTGVRDVHSLTWSPDGTRLAGVADNPDFALPLLGSSRRRPKVNQDSPDPEGPL